MSKSKHSIYEYLKKIKELGIDAEFSGNADSGNEIVEYLSYNSEDVKKGTLFICKGATFKEEYLQAAVKRGAKFYISEKKYEEISVPAIIVSDIRKAMAVLANFFYNFIWKDITILAITGTKGKSTTAYYIKSILDDYCKEQNIKGPAIVSGIKIYDGIEEKEANLTTPEPLELHKHIENAVECGIKYLILEVSSQALKYHRTYGIGFDKACFLNIGTDHISPAEHSNFEDYFSSKLKIFEQCKTGYVNMDSEYVNEICKAAKEGAEKVVSFAIGKAADFVADEIVSKNGISTFSIEENGKKENFCINMAGKFNVSNALAAVSMCRGLGIPFKNIKRGIADAKVEGRMQIYSDVEQKNFVIVDYAHNAMSFEALFESVKKEFKGRKIFIVFGCPGGKAIKRRQELGEISGREADFVYVTEEDPASEDLLLICKEVEEYVIKAGGKCEIIPNRGAAIKKAIERADENTVVLVTGKGEETYQKRGNTLVKTPSDVEYVKAALKK